MFLVNKSTNFFQKLKEKTSHSSFPLILFFLSIFPLILFYFPLIMNGMFLIQPPLSISFSLVSYLSKSIHVYRSVCVCLQAALGRLDVQVHSGTSLYPPHTWSINHCLILLLTVVQVWVAHAISTSDSRSMRLILIIAYKVIQLCFWFSLRVQCSWFFAYFVWTLHLWALFVCVCVVWCSMCT